MAPRLNQTDTKVVESYGFEFAEPPEQEGTRRSRYDEMWSAAKELCLKFPGQTLKVRNYNNASTAYNEAKSINNGEHRMFIPEEGHDANEWTAKAVKNTEVLNDKGEPSFDMYLIKNK